MPELALPLEVPGFTLQEVCVIPGCLEQLLLVTCTAMTGEDMATRLLFPHIMDFIDLCCVCSLYFCSIILLCLRPDCRKTFVSK